MPGLPASKVTNKRVKIYRLTHAIPFQENFRRGQDPCDPRLYRPYYMGEYDKDGKLIDEEDPFLYWLLPNLAERPDRRDSPIISYYRKHAGEPKYRYDQNKKKWIEATD
jgi:hypothetical protein